MIEDEVLLAVKMQRCQKTAKFLHGADYNAEVQTWQQIISNYMAVHNVTDAAATIAIAQECTDKGAPTTAITVIAAYVELISNN